MAKNVNSPRPTPEQIAAHEQKLRAMGWYGQSGCCPHPKGLHGPVDGVSRCVECGDGHPWEAARE